jgi:large conductance mechanosensitive channel
MSKFFGEFKKFITRGNVVDMAVGVIVGSSFTAIVNALSNNILKPFINYLLAIAFGEGALSDAFTFLKKEYVMVDGVQTAEIDLANSIYIDWGAFINAVINFFLVAFVLFVIVKVFNNLRDEHKKWAEDILDDIPTKEEKREMKKQGIKLRNRAAVKAFLADKKAKEAEAKAKAEAEAAEKARLERLANPTTEDLLKSILAELKNK